MITSKIESALNEQIPLEGYACSSYMSMASWCESKGLRGCAKFFYKQSDEEREHMLRIVHYINAAGGHAIIPAIKEPLVHYKSLAHAFEVSLEQEKSVTKAINKLVEQTFNAKDYSSFNFLQWYVAEQHEEESLFKTILDIIQISEGKNMIIVDNEIAKFAEQEKGKD